MSCSGWQLSASEQPDSLFAVQHLGGFSHEVNAAEKNGRRLHRRGITSQFQAVTDKIGHVLNFAINVVMREDADVFVAFELLDFLDQIKRIFFNFSQNTRHTNGHDSTPELSLNGQLDTFSRLRNANARLLS